MLLPWEYGVRNLARRPVRTALTLIALATVVMLVFVVVGFIRGLQRSLSISGDDQVVLVYSVNSEENIENSSIAARTSGLLTASLRGIKKRFGVTHISPELYLGTRVKLENGTAGLGLVRGVTHTAPLVRRSVQLTEGSWPAEGEVLLGQLAPAKLGQQRAEMKIGRAIEFEGRSWKISGRFAGGGGAYESEIWCNLADFQTATKRQDLSLVALLLAPGSSSAEVELWCKQRTDLELRAIRETNYYGSLQQHYQPVRLLAWLVVLLVSAAGVFAGLNMMYGAVAGRTSELAMLQAIGFRRRAILLSIVQESVLLSATASLVSGAIALTMLNGMAVRFTMGAFTLRIDSVAIMIGCGVGLFVGIVGRIAAGNQGTESGGGKQFKSSLTLCIAEFRFATNSLNELFHLTQRSASERKFQMYKMLMIICLGTVAVGCNRSQVATNPNQDDSTAASSSQYVADREPAGAVPVGEARQSVKDDEAVTLVGLIGGSTEPFVDGLAAFTIVDPKVPFCAPEEGCPTPWDYCCETDAVKENIATIKVVDESGNPITSDARQLLNVKELSTVVVQGKAQRDEHGNLTVAASKVFVRPAE